MTTMMTMMKDDGIIHIVQYQNNRESVDRNILIGFYQNIGHVHPPIVLHLPTLSWFSRKAGYKLRSPRVLTFPFYWKIKSPAADQIQKPVVYKYKGCPDRNTKGSWNRNTKNDIERLHFLFAKVAKRETTRSFLFQ